ncbi:MAG: dUTP diphosphatase [Candidatus Pelagibacter sp. TMED106]|jgi:dUTP pyrophosphatase|nr:MAG: dUTP diphosphatase [Candidatus Pelagibacter sp. TMED106]|tara:strand:- start:34 stop:471 length:438 start_codon:yes stop_codon:yes gene_type:complete
MVKVLIKRVSKEVDLPIYKTSGASGMDLMAFIEKSIELLPNSSCLIPTGLSVAFEDDYEIQIRPRSGLAAKNKITVLNTPGTIDSDYRGEIKIILFNHGKEKFIINNKDRIAQMILTPIVKMELEEVNDLPKSIRGKGGFGSTGK